MECGHSCCGFCGEICPPLCKICDKRKCEFYGLKEEEEQKFVYLEDCGHIIEVKCMENSIDKSLNIVKLPVCPKTECKKPIRRNFRFSFLIKYQLLLIEKVKIKTQATLAETLNFKIEFLDLVEKNKNKITNGYGQVILRLKNNIINNKYDSKIDFMEITNRVNFYFKLIDIESSIETNINNPLNKECLFYEIEKIKSSLLIPESCEVETFSIQFQQDIINEIKRVDKLFQYFKYQEQFSKGYFFSSLLDYYLYQLENLLIKKTSTYENIENEVVKLFDRLKIIAKQNCVSLINNDNLSLIIKRELPTCLGYWFQCKNGHIYCVNKSIGETANKICPSC